MPTTTLPRDGGCRCGRLRFRVNAEPLVTMACHCRGCQRMTASAFSLSASVPVDAFAVTGGDPVPGGLQAEAGHMFCSFCKGWVFSRIPGLDFMVNVRATLLDEPGDWATPFVETCTSAKLPWVATPAVHSFPEFPPEDAWPDILRGYAERSAA